MSATKVTLLFNYSSTNSAGQPERSSGFSETYYSTRAIDDVTLKVEWNALAQARANLCPANVSIIGSRYQTVDPTGASRQYDNKYPAGLTVQNDIPGMALQWTVRSPNSPNQRSVILRGIPDGRVVTGEYSPAANFGASLQAFFGLLQASWRFRAIDRTILPVQILTITGGLMTTAAAHGLAPGNPVNIMSTFVGTDPGTKTSYEAFVVTTPTATTATLLLPDRATVPTSVNGKVRKVSIIYPQISITPEEILNPTATHMKTGSPFKKYRGRRTSKR